MKTLSRMRDSGGRHEIVQRKIGLRCPGLVSRAMLLKAWSRRARSLGRILGMSKD
jgi:hypothetical protein